MKHILQQGCFHFEIGDLQIVNICFYTCMRINGNVDEIQILGHAPLPRNVNTTIKPEENTMNIVNRETQEKLAKLRDYFDKQDTNLDAYLITSYDQHKDKYVDERDRKIWYMTGYTGLGGYAIVTYNDAYLWVDKRNREKAYEEVQYPFELMDFNKKGFESAAEWLKNYFTQGAVVGSCGRYMPTAYWLELSKRLESYEIELIDVKQDLVNKIWTGRPKRPRSVIKPYPLMFSGEKSFKKILSIRHEMRCQDIDLLVVTELDNIAWLLNLRGSDITHDPLFYSFLILGLEHLDLFVEALDSVVMTHLFQEKVMLCEHCYDEFYDSLFELASKPSYKRISISPLANYEVYRLIPKSKVQIQTSLVSLAKCIKNHVEAAGIIEAYVYEGYALCKFFCWLNKELRKKNPSVTENSALKKLIKIKSENSDYLGESVPTVLAAGRNSSAMYYNNKPEADVPIKVSDIILCQSGSHYLCGTTDLARTYNFGKATTYQKECYTRVFKGQICLATTIFPEKTQACTLDALARRYLWRAGMDCAHPTGGGVGAYLCARIGPECKTSGQGRAGLKLNMFISTEPAYYEENAFGIKLQNIEQIIPAGIKSQDGRQYLTFENLSLCPYQTEMLVHSLLTPREILYVNHYHKRIRDLLCPVFRAEHNAEVHEWLMNMTEALVA